MFFKFYKSKLKKQMPHSIPDDFNLVRTYFNESGDLNINLCYVKTIKIIGTTLHFYDQKREVGCVDLFSKDLAMREFEDIVSTLNNCVEWYKKNN